MSGSDSATIGYQVNAPIKTITVPENRLRELRDYSGLAASMKELGLLQPITLTESGVLVSGRHRLEAAKSLGWKEIPAFVVEDDELHNRLIEIDENLKRLDLTVYEQGKHAAEREKVLEALGQRASRGAQTGNQNAANEPATVAGSFRTTGEIAADAGMSERSWQNRTKIGRELGEQTRAVLDQADPTEEKHRNLLNSTTQLNHLANISTSRGDGTAAEVARLVLTEEGASTFKAYDKLKGDRGELIAAEAVKDLPPFELSETRKAYYRVSRYLVGLSRLDPGEVASECESEKAAKKDMEDAASVADWFGRYAQALSERGKLLEPGSLRRVK